MHLKDDIRPLIPVAPETQVDSQNRPEDQLLAQQDTSGHKKRCAKSPRLRLGAADQPEDHNLLENYIAPKLSALDCQCSSPRELGWPKWPTIGSYLMGNKFNCHVCFDNTEVEFSRKDVEL